MDNKCASNAFSLLFSKYQNQSFVLEHAKAPDFRGLLNYEDVYINNVTNPRNNCMSNSTIIIFFENGTNSI